ncbi:hypothetical protein KIN20_021689 [Parelaphostrongylus tenuis]|uniref:G domain-containing protein n=1 Tax=Parelaphostrongylus tenuis TaxID=148309 RepID=A0AAD5QUP2_PARTN|nr:hypothetical protein KIN20_021689 [Parelaphostrongylus tenuis]
MLLKMFRIFVINLHCLQISTTGCGSLCICLYKWRKWRENYALWILLLRFTMQEFQSAVEIRNFSNSSVRCGRHILVMNKMDLINMKKYKQPIEDYYRHEQGITDIIWTDCKRRISRALSNVQQTVLDVLVQSPRFNRMVKTEYQVMVVGIPNVGKSSLINSWRSHNLGMKRSAVMEGARPGVTVRVQNRVRVLDKATDLCARHTRRSFSSN